jgi:hypothetical protein
MQGTANQKQNKYIGGKRNNKTKNWRWQERQNERIEQQQRDHPHF